MTVHPFADTASIPKRPVAASTGAVAVVPPKASSGARGLLARGASAAGRRRSTLRLGPAAPKPGPVRVSLLPQELRHAKRVALVKRALVVLVLVTGAGVGVATTGAAASAGEAARRAAAASSEADVLQARTFGYSSVRDLEQETAVAKAAIRVGSATQVDWQALIGQIKGVMPAGFRISAITIDSASPTADYGQGFTPLEGERIGTVTVTAQTDSIEQLPDWVENLRSIRGYVDATPTVSSDGAGYTVVVPIHVSSAAYITPLEKGAGR